MTKGCGGKRNMMEQPPRRLMQLQLCKESVKNVDEIRRKVDRESESVQGVGWITPFRESITENWGDIS